MTDTLTDPAPSRCPVCGRRLIGPPGRSHCPSCDSPTSHLEVAA